MIFLLGTDIFKWCVGGKNHNEQIIKTYRNILYDYKHKNKCEIEITEDNQCHNYISSMGLKSRSRLGRLRLLAYRTVTCLKYQ